MNPVAVITAKRESKRLPGKNLLPLGGKPLAAWSIDEARRLGLDTVVSTDVPELTQYAMERGCASVRQVTDGSQTHAEVIRAALEQTGRADRPCILLQPTSPFRYGDIAARCWRAFVAAGGEATVVTSNVVHVAEQDGEAFVNHGRAATLWDGNVAVFPAGRVCDFTRCVTVRNIPVNTVQIDTEEDYVAACLTLEVTKPLRPAVALPTVGLVAGLLQQTGLPHGCRVAVVGRPGPVPDDVPVFYVNHCRGYVGGRVDGLFVIANPAIRSQGINAELREVAQRAKVVLVRDNGQFNWLAEALPEMRGKCVPLRACLDRLDDHLTSGAILCDLLDQCGYRPELIGAYRPGAVADTLVAFHRPAMSREIALLWHAGVF